MCILRAVWFFWRHASCTYAYLFFGLVTSQKVNKGKKKKQTKPRQVFAHSGVTQSLFFDWFFDCGRVRKYIQTTTSEDTSSLILGSGRENRAPPHMMPWVSWCLLKHLSCTRTPFSGSWTSRRRSPSMRQRLSSSTRCRPLCRKNTKSNISRCAYPQKRRGAGRGQISDTVLRRQHSVDCCVTKNESQTILDVHIPRTEEAKLGGRSPIQSIAVNSVDCSVTQSESDASLGVHIPKIEVVTWGGGSPGVGQSLLQPTRCRLLCHKKSESQPCLGVHTPKKEHAEQFMPLVSFCQSTWKSPTHALESHEWVMSLADVSCHTHACVISCHLWMHHVARANQVCRTCESGVPHTWERDFRVDPWISHVTYEWVVPHVCMSRVTRMNESCHTYEWVVSHVWMSHVAHMRGSVSQRSIDKSCYVWMSHVTHTKKSRRTNKRENVTEING